MKSMFIQNYEMYDVSKGLYLLLHYSWHYCYRRSCVEVIWIFLQLLDWWLVLDCRCAGLLWPRVSPALAWWELVQAGDRPAVWALSAFWSALCCHPRSLGPRPVKAISWRSQGTLLQHLCCPCKGFILFSEESCLFCASLCNDPGGINWGAWLYMIRNQFTAQQLLPPIYYSFP